MSKFDRCIFISIAVGIWALAMTQVFDSKPINASNHRVWSWQYKLGYVIGECPPWSDLEYVFNDWQKKWDAGSTTGQPDWNRDAGRYNCRYNLVTTYEDVKNGKIPPRIETK